MNTSQRDDFILRQVAGVGAALARLIGLRRDGAADEARVELNVAYGLLLGPRSDLLRMVDVATAAVLIEAPEAILALARLTAEEGEQEGDADRRAALRLRAAALGIEALRRDEALLDARAFLANIMQMIDPQGLSLDQRSFIEEPGRLRP